MSNLILTPVLGTILLDKQPLHGDRNTSRWIVDIRTPERFDPNEPLSVSFQLLHGPNLQRPKLYSFSFGPLDAHIYRARPWLAYDPETFVFTLFALPMDPEEGLPHYLLSIDCLHSMHR